MRGNHHDDPPDPPALQEILTVFRALTGLRATARDADGMPAGEPDAGWPRFCRIVRESGPAAPRCETCICEAAPPAGDYCARVFRCCAGLTYGAVRLPNPDGDAVLVTCGPVLVGRPSPEARDELVRRAAAHHGAPPAALRASLGEIQVVPSPALNAALDLLRSLVCWRAAGRQAPSAVPAGPTTPTDGMPHSILAAMRSSNETAAMRLASAALESEGEGDPAPQRVRALGLVSALCREAGTEGISTAGLDSIAGAAAAAIAAATSPEAVTTAVRRAIQSLAAPAAAGDGCGARLAGRAAAYVESHYQRDLSLQEAAQHVRLSPAYFSALFKRERGMGFKRYLRQVRLTHACRLLEDTDKSIEEIASAVGFEDPHYFSRVFSQSQGLPPGEYRRRARAA